MIQELIQLALRLRFVVFLGALGLVVGGISAYRQLDIEAYPNPVPPLVEVITQPSGWSAEEVERYVIGAQTQKPLAVVVIGGSLILAVLTRAMQPPLLLLAHRWREGVEARRAGAPPPVA